MVQLRKKVTLKTKSEQKPVGETAQKNPAQPTLRKSKRKNGIYNIIKTVGGIVVAAVIFYGVYSLFGKSSDYTDDNVTSIENTESDVAVATENNTKEVNDGDTTAGITEGTVAEGHGNNETEDVAAPVNDNVTSDTPAQPEQTQDIPAKPATPATEQAATTASVSLSGTLEQKAKEVIRGNYGNGEVRKRKLGEQYSEIQSKVNEMYRKGLVR